MQLYVCIMANKEAVHVAMESISILMWYIALFSYITQLVSSITQLWCPFMSLVRLSVESSSTHGSIASYLYTYVLKNQWIRLLNSYTQPIVNGLHNIQDELHTSLDIEWWIAKTYIKNLCLIIFYSLCKSVILYFLYAYTYSYS